jgi:predicted RNA binding protein YcfA (HicA-like mRNA interferase family)
MENIQPIIDLLERDDALELDEDAHTYTDEQDPVAVDWPAVFPTASLGKGNRDWELLDDPWRDDIPEDIVGEVLEGRSGTSSIAPSERREFPADVEDREGAIWDVCAWYQPIHFFAHDWGIFVREDCLISLAARIAPYTGVSVAALDYRSRQMLTKACLRAAFAAFFLHEHFHHKVECLGLRLHVVLGASAYLPYKRKVYRPHYLTDDCLEEALANADAYRRLSTQPYSSIMGPTVRRAIKSLLKTTYPSEPPGYRRADRYLAEGAFSAGENQLQGQVKEATLTPAQPKADWDAAKRLLQSYYSLRSDIYTVVPKGGRPILPAKVLPKTCSADDMVKIYRARGYSVVSGGKGSHVKLKKPGSPTMILPGNRKDLSPGVLNNALKNLGDYTIDDIDRLLRAA